MAKEYTQTVKPVSRIAEKIFGWLGWLILLFFTIGILFFSLVQMNDQQTIDQFSMMIEEQMVIMDMEGVDPQAAVDAGIALLSNSWIAAVYLMFPLILGLLGLLNMRRRILAGILLLVAAILAAPFFATLISSLFLVIAAILLFARKDIVLRNDPNTKADDYAQRDPQQQNRVMTPPVDDDVKVRHSTRHNDDVEMRNNTGRNNRDEAVDRDIESTRKFDRIDEEDGTRVVDTNIDSQNIDRPVTDREYKRQSGVELEDLDDFDKEDPTQTRRDNVDRRNRE